MTPSPLRFPVTAADLLSGDRTLAEAVLDAVSDAVIALDLDHRVLHFGRGAEQLYRVRREAALGRPLSEIYRYEWLSPGDEAAALHSLETTGGWRGTNVHRLPDGTRLHVESTVSLLRGPQGERAGLLAVIRDRTAEREAVERLAQERALLEHMLDVLPVMVTRYDTVLSRVRLNREFVATLGWTEDDARVGDIMALCYPDPGLRAEVAAFMSRPGAGWREVPTCAKDGRTLRVLWSNVRLAGDLQAGVGLDVTDARRVEQSLRESEERARVALDAAELGTFRHDHRTGFVQLDARAARQYGLDRLVVPRDELLARIHPDDLVKLHAAMQRAIEPDAPLREYTAEYRVVHADGAVRWISVRGRIHFALENGVPRSVLGVAATQDVTARKDAELALREYAQRLREADRRKDVFIATLAHELRNPLAPIRAAVRVLGAPNASERDQRWCREVIDRQVGTMGRLLEDLLDVARITRGKLSLQLEPVLLSRVIESAVETSRPLLEARGHALAVELPAEPVRLEVDPVRLCQVFANLLNNAARYTPEGGRVAVRATAGAGEVCVEVVDTGIGLEPAALTRVFEMFSQVQSDPLHAGGGLGIGLALVKGLVELHGGRVEAASAGPGAGATFRVVLPRLAEADAADAPAQARGVASIARRVLVADDNHDSADSLAMVLRLDGHDVRVAYSGDEALAAALAFRPEFAFLDIGMPGLDGYALAARLRKSMLVPRPTLVAVTGWGQAEDRRRALAAGYDHHLTKPVDPADLARLLAAARSD